MAVGFPVEEVTEGWARVLVPRLDGSTGVPEQRLRSMAPVFYNPVMKTNRDTAVLVLRAHQRLVGRGVAACEPMAGSGVRGIRLALEAEGVERVVMGDLSPTAVRLGELNAERNGVSDRVGFRLLDANLLLALHCYPGGRFDYVDVDPYGSPAPFMDTAVRSVNNKGVAAFTATDMAPLCGVNPKACLRKYGAAPLAGSFCHETAVRLVTGAVVRTAAVHERAATPLFSCYSDHYVRVYCRLDSQALPGVPPQGGFDGQQGGAVPPMRLNDEGRGATVAGGPVRPRVPFPHAGGLDAWLSGGLEGREAGSNGGGRARVPALVLRHRQRLLTAGCEVHGNGGCPDPDQGGRVQGVQVSLRGQSYKDGRVHGRAEKGFGWLVHLEEALGWGVADWAPVGWASLHGVAADLADAVVRLRQVASLPRPCWPR